MAVMNPTGAEIGRDSLQSEVKVWDPDERRCHINRSIS